jgi:hypothetical protein
MKERTLGLTLLTGLLLLGLEATAQTIVPVPPVVAGVTNMTSGKIQFAEPIFDFGRIKSGDIINHKFVFTNIGAETLTINQVHASCGCTATAEWTRKVEPGETGVIPVVFNSQNFSGHVLKTISVMSSSSQQPAVLQIKGEIWKPLEITPTFAVINIPPDAKEGSTTVRILNNTSEPLSFSDPEINNRSFKAVLEPSTNNPAKEFIFRIRTVGSLTNSVQGQISFKTGSTNVPSVTITAWANVQQAVVVLPGQITLPAGPLQAPITPSVLVQNNSTNNLQITEAAVNSPDVKVDVRETQPGRQFSIALTFPAGFEIRAGEQVMLTASTSNPSTPTIRVPVAQLPRALGGPGPVRSGARSQASPAVPAALANH